ncbi:MAG: DUF1996 domain-containing protein [Pseudomonadota bacterium]
MGKAYFCRINVLWAVLVAALLSACGGGGDDSNAAAAADSSVTQIAAALDSAAEPTQTWSFVARQGLSFTVNATQTVRFGTGTNWISKSVSGTGMCSSDFFGKNPTPGLTKMCQVLASGTAPMNAVMVDTSLIPKGTFAGWAHDMLIPTTEQPTPSDIGAFRTGCQFSHMAFDDPIVYPGQPGKSHLHTFFGNKKTNANSTAQSIATTGKSTCRGGTINRSAYWVPSMIDTRDGRPLTPMFESNFYYKTGYGVPAASIQAMPAGLRMVAGDAKGTPDMPSGAALYACIWDGGNSNWSNSIPSCPKIGFSWLIQGVDFPQCWDGVNLDSPDHKSHMSNPVDVLANNTGHCPSTHPVAIPAIAYQILYEVKVSDETKYWRLSSDNYDKTKPAGYSGHGDWFNGWKSRIVDVWVKNCDRAQMDCHSHLLGDGRAMVIP